MENKRNFYAEYNEYYKSIEVKEVTCKVIPTFKNSLPFPYLPFTDDIDDERLKGVLLSISNNDELFFLATEKFDENNILTKYNKVGAVCRIECVNAKDKGGINYICNVLYFASIEEFDMVEGVEQVRCVPVITYNTETDNTKLLLEKTKNLFLMFFIKVIFFIFMTN